MTPELIPIDGTTFIRFGRITVNINSIVAIDYDYDYNAMFDWEGQSLKINELTEDERMAIAAAGEDAAAVLPGVINLTYGSTEKVLSFSATSEEGLFLKEMFKVTAAPNPYAWMMG